MPKYNKLVRDKVPDVLEAAGLDYTAYTVNNDELRDYLGKKLTEEVTEFLECPSLEELADIQEVMNGILQAYRWSETDLEYTAIAKREERGAFTKGIILREVVAK
jgi:predicted house-cleaning noncanonical NTP pyrophosphatase (MazG superfamily)